MARFFESAWGSVRLWLANISTDEGRSLIVSPYSSGNVPDLRDRGDVPKAIRCTLLFDEMIGESREASDRLEDLILLKQKGQPQLFTHPIFGTFLASIEAFTYSIDGNGTITAEATFYAAEEIGAVTVDPVGVSLDVAGDDIGATAQQVTEQLADVGLESDLPASATSAATAIDSGDTSARDVLVQVATVSDRLWDEIDELNMAAAIELWPAMRAYVMLGDAVRAGGDRALGDAGAFMTVRVDETTSLRRLVADIYGAAEAEDRYTEAIELNDVRTPGAIPAGTQLRLRQPAARV